MRRRWLDRLLHPIAVLAWFALAVVLFVATNLEAAGSEDLYRKIRLFSEVLKNLDDNYVTSVDYDSLLDGAISGMLDQLDPHTQYFPPREASAFLTQIQGEYGGFGINFEQQGGYIVVIEPMPGYSAAEQGILAGDRILKVDGVSVVDIPTEEAQAIIRGPAGTHATVTVQRPGVETELVFDIERRIIKIDNIPYAFRLDNGVGYIRVRQFSQNIAGEVRAKLDELEGKGLRGLIVDMRFNPGGSLDQAVDMVNEFVGPGKLVVSSRGRSTASNVEYYTKYNRVRSGYPVIVLVNRYSASAAEIFAGSLQDYDVALIMGETSFGKGSVQTMFPLSSGMIKITIAHYYLVSGRCVHREENDRLLRGKEVTALQKASFDKQRAEDVHYTQKGRIVYGGGGITPDLTVVNPPMTEFATEMRRRNLATTFAGDYIKRHEVKTGFTVTDPLRNEFLSFMRENGLDYSPAEIDSNRVFIDSVLAGAILTEMFGEQAGFEAMIPIDEQLSEAILMFDRCPTLTEMLQYAETMKKVEK
jgi:carboxyl-terminal processing protease